MNLAQLLEQSSANFGRRCALLFQRRKLSYYTLNSKVNQLTWALRGKLGESGQNRIGILLNNSPEFIISLFAIFKAGCVAVPINTFLKPREIDYIINDSDIDLLISSSHFLEVIEGITLDMRVILVDKKKEGYLFMSEVIEGISNKNPDLELNDEDLALIIYTSGTTGHPKGAMLTHRNLLSNVTSCAQVAGINLRDRLLLLLPMFHSFTITVCILLPLFVGAKIVVIESVRPFRRLLRILIFRRITLLVGIPHFFKILTEINLPWVFFKLISLRLCICGAAHLDEEIMRNFENKFRRPLLEGYGLTEASPVVSLNPPHRAKPASVGLPLPGIGVKVVAEDESELTPGEIGELIIKGANVMKGYLNLPQATQEAIKGSWLFSGDLARIDEEGYIYIVDRKKDMLISHGMNVYPREIEVVLLTNPRIKEAAVIGRKDSRRGEIPVAFVVAKEGEELTCREVIDFCNQRLASYKVPHIIEFRKDLPKTPTGKVLKRNLK